MVKYFCDVCEKEISPKEDEWYEVSAKDRYRKNFYFSNPRRQERLLCKECFEKMLKVIGDGKEVNDGKIHCKGMNKDKWNAMFVDEFIKQYSFKDKEEIYTNGSDLIPVFRVEQMLNHYFHYFLEKEQTDGKT